MQTKLNISIFQLDWLSKIGPEEKNAHIDVSSVRNLNYSIIFQADGNNSNQKAKLLCDHMKIYQSMYSKRFPSKRYDGIMNVYYIILNPDATTNEINIALVRHILCRIGTFIWIGDDFNKIWNHFTMNIQYILSELFVWNWWRCDKYIILR